MLAVSDAVRRTDTYFHQKAGHPGGQAPTAKELTQAKHLLIEHGDETSRALVDFAFARAAETNFQMEHFGAILSYIPRALAALDAAEHQRAADREGRRRQAHEDARLDAYKTKRERLLSNTAFQRRLRERIDQEQRRRNNALEPWHIGAIREQLIREEVERRPRTEA